MSSEGMAFKSLLDEDGGLQKFGWMAKNAEFSELLEAIQELYGMAWYLANQNVPDFIESERRRADKKYEIFEEAAGRFREGLELSPTERFQPLDYDGIIDRAQSDPGYRDALRDAARVARAQGHDVPGKPDCPPDILATYLDRLADGEKP